jgi:hypothetical protein
MFPFMFSGFLGRFAGNVERSPCRARRHTVHANLFIHQILRQRFGKAAYKWKYEPSEHESDIEVRYELC